MRVLFVEDNISFAKSISRELEKIPDCEVVWAQSRDTAFAQLANGPFDLIILDRRLPSADNAMDDAQEHGWAVFQEVRNRIPGTSVFFLTATEDADFPTQLLNDHSRSEDVHGTGASEQMYRVFWKKRPDECLARVRAFATQCAELDRIAINRDAGERAVPDMDCRVLRQFGRRNNGAAIHIKELSGGLSSSRVLKIVVRQADGTFMTSAVAKISGLPDIDDESSRYRADIMRLTAGGFPVLAAAVVAGAADRGGLFYAMVGENVESLFDRMVAGDPDTALTPGAVRQIMNPWYQGSQVAQTPVSRIRRKLLPDTDLPAIQAELDGIDIAAAEAREITAIRCSQHGDLHCANIVFDQRGVAMLIDFGDAGHSYASVDPVTLELSTVFHLEASRLPANWPTEAQMGDWTNLDTYLGGCSFPEFVRSCRQWASDVAGSPEEIAAVAYSYGLRQLKYADTNKVLARALIRHCITRIVNPS